MIKFRGEEMLISGQTNHRLLLQYCGLLFLLIFSIGCSSDSNGGETPTDPGGGSSVLFQEDYSNTFLSTSWTPTIIGIGGTVGIDTVTGQPAPSLSLQCGSAFPTQSQANLLQPYNNVGGVTFTLQVAVDNPGRAGLNTDGIRIVIYDQGRSTAQAGVTIRRFTTDSTNVNISYEAYPGGFPFQLVEEKNIALSTGFHEIRFTVYPDLTAKWYLDGVQRLATLTGVQLLEADLQLRLNVSGPDAAAHFDNVVVSR